jgi:hypothetical protein
MANIKQSYTPEFRADAVKLVSMIKKHSVPMPAYNAGLSLLWVDQDIGL